MGKKKSNTVDAFEVAYKKLRIHEGTFIATVVADDRRLIQSKANRGKVMHVLTWRTEEGYEVKQNVTDCLTWASGSNNYTRQQFMEAMGLESDDDFPSLKFMKKVEAVVRVREESGVMTVYKVESFFDDVSEIEIEF